MSNHFQKLVTNGYRRKNTETENPQWLIVSVGIDFNLPGKNPAMKGKIMFKTQSLLEKVNGNITGPMSPVLAAKSVAAQLNIPLNGLSRIWWTTGSIHQAKDEETGYDTLLIGSNYNNCKQIFMMVDSGYDVIPVAFGWSDESDPTITPAYEKSNIRKLSQQDITSVFKHCFENWEKVFTIEEE